VRGFKPSAFPAWLPDQLPVNVLTTADNVLPYEGGFGPVGAFSSVSATLTGAFQGAASFISTDGQAYLMAGTASGLYRLAAGAWTGVVTGLTITGRWRFIQFGNYAVTVNDDVTREVDLATGTAAAIAGAPTANSIAVVAGHIVVGQPGGQILDVAWSALNDRSGWTPGVDQAGQETMTTGGEVLGIASGEYGVVLQRTRLVRMDATGDADTPFAFNEITNNYGCASAASIVQAGRTVFFLSDRGFMALEDGQAIRPIGNEKFDRHFRDTVPREDWEKLYAVVDPRRTLVIWAMPGSPGKAWVYNWVLDKATTLTLPFDGFFAGYETGVTLEELTALYGTLEAVPYSLDDPRFQGGAPALYAVVNGQVGVLTGSNLAFTVEQGFIMPSGNRARVRALWPEIDATCGVTARCDGYERMGDTPDSVSNGTMQASGRIPLRVSGRYLRPRFEGAAGTVWTLFTGYRLEAEAAGMRR
jgi:hypothetical protein